MRLSSQSYPRVMSHLITQDVILEPKASPAPTSLHRCWTLQASELLLFSIGTVYDFVEIYCFFGGALRC